MSRKRFHGLKRVHDGSELAAGRGSGLEQKRYDPNDPQMKEPRKKFKIPYMAQTFAPIERRLDVAVFRALFASSARQARQFVTHGSVKVNGQKVRSGYLLNPGDMFQVEPERVLFATGQTKTAEQVKKGREKRKVQREVNARRHEKRIEARAQALKNAAAKIAAQKKEALAPTPRPILSEPMGDVEARKQRRSDLQALVTQVKALMENTKSPPSAKKKQELRKFTKDPPTKTETAPASQSSSVVTTVSNAAKQRARKALQESRQNIIDESKPICTLLLGRRLDHKNI
ncbi:putative 37S ribosomal protein NAM9, mitochondrial [Glarea lozoyensis 74030]|uniref:Putative 37S ribosomal protein NAM9, mitochondrial n=1 Tax=Glarea lozoyensis (strain ATCC 74030 / MF5533) TaxID=1104152 RepID=H0EFJ8_GLAL7|nr:putative 37S ribosomal protein NAM9, mitochondrial [Glarea lozoyensis 74030]